MSKHTPGPWTTNEADHDAPYQDIKIKAGKHHTVCTVWIDDAPVHDFNALQEANARLIAAAPMMYEALKGITPPMPPADAPCHVGLVPQENCAHCGRIARARAAIAKAEGQ